MGTPVTKPDNDAGGYEPTPVTVAPGTPASLNDVLTRTCLPSLGRFSRQLGRTLRGSGTCALSCRPEEPPGGIEAVLSHPGENRSGRPATHGNLRESQFSGVVDTPVQLIRWIRSLTRLRSS